MKLGAWPQNSTPVPPQCQAAVPKADSLWAEHHLAASLTRQAAGSAHLCVFRYQMYRAVPPIKTNLGCWVTRLQNRIRPQDPRLCHTKVPGQWGGWGVFCQVCLLVFPISLWSILCVCLPGSQGRFCWPSLPPSWSLALPTVRVCWEGCSGGKTSKPGSSLARVPLCLCGHQRHPSHPETAHPHQSQGGRSSP